MFLTTIRHHLQSQLRTCGQFHCLGQRCHWKSLLTLNKLQSRSPWRKTEGERNISALTLLNSTPPASSLYTWQCRVHEKGLFARKAANVLSSQTARSESSWQCCPFSLLNVWNRLHKELTKHPDLMPWWLWEKTTTFAENNYSLEEWKKGF